MSVGAWAPRRTRDNARRRADLRVRTGNDVRSRADLLAHEGALQVGRGDYSARSRCGKANDPALAASASAPARSTSTAVRR